MWVLDFGLSSSSGEGRGVVAFFTADDHKRRDISTESTRSDVSVCEVLIDAFELERGKLASCQSLELVLHQLFAMLTKA